MHEKRGEDERERGRWIALCCVVLGRRQDWGWSLEIATGDELIQSFKWLWENQSKHAPSLCDLHPHPFFSSFHTCSQSSSKISSVGWSSLQYWSASVCQLLKGIQAHRYTSTQDTWNQGFLRSNLARLAQILR